MRQLQAGADPGAQSASRTWGVPLACPAPCTARPPHPAAAGSGPRQARSGAPSTQTAERHLQVCAAGRQRGLVMLGRLAKAHAAWAKRRAAMGARQQPQGWLQLGAGGCARSAPNQRQRGGARQRRSPCGAHIGWPQLASSGRPCTRCTAQASVSSTNSVGGFLPAGRAGPSVGCTSRRHPPVRGECRAWRTGTSLPCCHCSAGSLVRCTNHSHGPFPSWLRAEPHQDLPRLPAASAARPAPLISLYAPAQLRGWPSASDLRGRQSPGARAPVFSSPQSSLHSPCPRQPLGAAPSARLPSGPVGGAPHSGVRAGGGASAT